MIKAFAFEPDWQEVSLDSALVPLTRAIDDHRLVVFFGAGISRSYPCLNPLVAPSGLPGLRNLLIDGLFERAQLQDVLPPEVIRALRQDLESKTLEYLLDHLAKLTGDRAFEALDLLEAKPKGCAGGPNYRHYWLADLARSGACDTFATVNFDTHLESALRAFGIDPWIPEDQVDESEAYRSLLHGSASAGVRLLKLHGTLCKPRSLLTTAEALGELLPRPKRQALAHVLQGKALFAMGYRAGDFDVFPGLCELPPWTRIDWFEIREENVDRAVLSRLLRGRPHSVLVCSELSDLLAEITRRRGGAEGPILDALGVTSRSELIEKESQNLGPASLAIQEFVERVLRADLPQALARLILSEAGDLPSGGFDLRKRIFDSLRESDFSARDRFAYRSVYAERLWGSGRFKRSTVVRRKALRELSRTGWSQGIAAREQIEQELRMARDAAKAARPLRKEEIPRSARWLALAATSFARAVFHLSAAKRRLTTYERSRLSLMLLIRPVRLLHHVLDRRVEAQIRIRLEERAPRMSWKRPRFDVRILAHIVSACYQVLLRMSASSLGWMNLCREGRAEALLHLQCRFSPETARLIRRSQRPIASASRHSLPSPLQRGLLFAYGGKAEAATRCLDSVDAEYENRQYLSGRTKAKLFLAINQAISGDLESAERTLDLLSRWKVSR